MNKALKILDNLLEEADTQGNIREHVLESSSYAVQNVVQNLELAFDSLVGDISERLGKPHFSDRMGSN